MSATERDRDVRSFPGCSRGLSAALVVALMVAACTAVSLPDEQRRLVAEGDLRLQQITSRAVLAAWGRPSYSSVQRTQFFPLTAGNWVPGFRVKLGDLPAEWDLTTVIGEGLFLAYVDRGEVLGFYEDRLVYREHLPEKQIHALGKEWRREALFRTRLEDASLRR